MISSLGGWFKLAFALLVGLWTCDVLDRYGEPDVGRSDVAVAKMQALADGADSVDVVVILHRANGAALPGFEISIVAPGAQVTQPSALTDVDGIARGSLTSLNAGPVRVQARYRYQGYAGTLTQTAQVDFSAPAVTTPVAMALTLTMPAHFVAGASQTAVVTAIDENGQTVGDYVGPVTLASSDADFSPTSVTMVPEDGGKKTIAARFVKSGAQTLQATDPLNQLIDDQATVTVTAANANTLSIDPVAATVPAGTASDIVVTAYDAYGNRVPTFSADVTLTGSDPLFGAARVHTFSVSDQGRYTFLGGVTWKTAGTQQVSATTSATPPVISAGVSSSVMPASATQFGVVAPTSVGAGLPFVFEVTVRDAYANTVQSFDGVVQMTSTDAQGFLPAPYTFSPSQDAGHHAFGALLRTASAAQTITAKNTGLSLQGNTSVTVTSDSARAHSMNLPPCRESRSYPPR